eukprot:scaffold60785_cov36-Tisochrysis_lutea.AAC.2
MYTPTLVVSALDLNTSITHPHVQWPLKSTRRSLLLHPSMLVAAVGQVSWTFTPVIVVEIRPHRGGLRPQD